MYVPAHFAAPSDDAVAALLRDIGAAELITSHADGLTATLLPLIHDPGERGGHGSLRGHLARNNPQWREPVTGPALVIARGPDGYVSPNWYASKAEHGRVVPTWNYVTVHVHGTLIVHDDVEWTERIVRDLTAKHEASFDPPWRVDDAPPAYIAGQLRAIVGVELRITRIEAKYKLSQNRPAADIEGVIAGLADGPLRDAMRDPDGHGSVQLNTHRPTA